MSYFSFLIDPIYRPSAWSEMTLRIFEEAEFSGGDVFDCQRTLSKIRPGNLEDWYTEWYKIGKQKENDGDERLKDGHEVSAKQDFLHAYNYYRLSYFYMSNNDERKKEAYLKGYNSFRKASVLLNPRPEYIEVPFQGKKLEGIFFPSGAKERSPLVIFIGGVDGQKEEAYFVGVQELQQRGISVLAIEGPGQAGALLLEKVPMMAEYEKPVGAFIDAIADRSDIDPEKIAILGRSFGGYIAPRAAAFDSRIKACVVWGAYYDMYENKKSQPDDLNKAIMEMLMVEDKETFLEKSKGYSLDGVIDKVTCPLLIIHGAADPMTPAWNAQKMYENAKCEKTLKLFKLGEPGAGHCTHDAPSIVFPLIYDWLYDKLKKN